MMDACSVPPVGWMCTRGAGHEGPCAAVPDDNYVAWLRYAYNWRGEARVVVCDSGSEGAFRVYRGVAL